MKKSGWVAAITEMFAGMLVITALWAIVEALRMFLASF